MNDVGKEHRLTLLVSLEPRAYSEVIGYTIGAMRPRLDVEVVEPDSLYSEVENASPEIVLCSKPYCGRNHNSGPYWVEYYPYAERPGETIRVNGRRSRMVNVEMDDLLDLVDRATAFHCSS